MLKNLMSLLCSLFVPRRAVSGGGGRLVYGVDASTLGVPDYSSFLKVDLPDGTAPSYTVKGTYTVPYDALVSATSTEPNSGESAAAVALSVSSNGNTASIISCVRREKYNNTTYVIARKGDVVTYSLCATGNYLKVYKLLPY